MRTSLSPSSTKASIAFIVFAICVVSLESNAQSALQQRGRTLAVGMCGGCHAVGPAGESPHIAAPPFRALSRGIDFDKFVRRLQEGILTGHHDMPMFRFTNDDARALVAYMRSIEAP
jgi:mono/diheme cytochrome c family protein